MFLFIYLCSIITFLYSAIKKKITWNVFFFHFEQLEKKFLISFVFSKIIRNEVSLSGKKNKKKKFDEEQVIQFIARFAPGDRHPRGNHICIHIYIYDNKRSLSSFNEVKKRLFKSVKCGFARCVFRSFYVWWLILSFIRLTGK